MKLPPPYLHCLIVDRPTAMRRYLTILSILLLVACQPQVTSLPPTVIPAIPESPPAQILPSPTNPPTLTPFAPLPPTPTFTVVPSPTASPTPKPDPKITLLFTGVIVPARCVQAAIDERGEADYIFAEVRGLISQADLAVGTLNATLSDYPPHLGCVFTYVLVGDSRSAVAMGDAGFDVMSVATNHIKNCGIGDCGDRAFLETLENLRAAEILPVGAGKNLKQAMKPVVVTLKGVRFGIVSLGMVEPMVFATENTPGIAVLTDDNLRSAIAAARKEADVVIVMPHWGPEDSSAPNEWQLHYAEVAVDAGADLVVGNHTHVIQAIQQINGVNVFYGLGNFVFDQTWDLAHQQGVMLLVKFRGKRLMGYELIPTHVDGDGTVHIAGAEEAAEVLERIEEVSQELKE